MADAQNPPRTRRTSWNFPVDDSFRRPPTAAAAGATAACGGDSGSSGSKDSKDITLWYWGGGLSDKVVADAVNHFAATGQDHAIGHRRRLQAEADHHPRGRQSVPDITGIKGEDIASLLPQRRPFVDLNDLGCRQARLAVPGLEVEAGQTRTAS